MLYDLGVDSVDGVTRHSPESLREGVRGIILREDWFTGGEIGGVLQYSMYTLARLKKYEKKHLTALLRGQGEFDWRKILWSISLDCPFKVAMPAHIWGHRYTCVRTYT